MSYISEVQNLIVRNGSIQLGNPDFLGATTTLSAATPASSCTITIPDPGVTACSLKVGVESIVPITSATTVSASNSGKKFTIANSGSAYSITLPAPTTQGLNFNFIVQSALNAAVTITASSAIIQGNLLSSNGTAVTGGAILNSSPKTNVIIGTTANPGDSYSFYANGSRWIVLGFTAVNTSVTVS